MASPDSTSDQTPAQQEISQTQEYEPSPLQTPMISTPATPTETRHPLSRFESAAEEPEYMLASSFQSTDTVRRMPDDNAVGSGTFFCSSGS